MICRLCGDEFTETRWDEASQIKLKECNDCWFRQQMLFEDRMRKETGAILDYLSKQHIKEKERIKNKPIVNKLNQIIKEKKCE